MCLATSSHSFPYCLKSINPPILKWTLRKKKKRQLRQKGLSIFIELCGFLKQQCGPGLFQGFSNTVIPKQTESASHNVVLRKRTNLPSASLWAEKACSLLGCLQNGKHSLAHYVASLHPRLVSINGWGEPTVDPLKSNLQPIYWICRACTSHSTAARRTGSNVGALLLLPVRLWVHLFARKFKHNSARN